MPCLPSYNIPSLNRWPNQDLNLVLSLSKQVGLLHCVREKSKPPRQCAIEMPNLNVSILIKLYALVFESLCESTSKTSSQSYGNPRVSGGGQVDRDRTGKMSSRKISEKWASSGTRLKRLRRTGGAGGIMSPNASLTRDEPGTKKELFFKHQRQNISVSNTAFLTALIWCALQRSKRFAVPSAG